MAAAALASLAGLAALARRTTTTAPTARLGLLQLLEHTRVLAILARIHKSLLYMRWSLLRILTRKNKCSIVIPPRRLSRAWEGPTSHNQS